MPRNTTTAKRAGQISFPKPKTLLPENTPPNDLYDQLFQNLQNDDLGIEAFESFLLKIGEMAPGTKLTPTYHRLARLVRHYDELLMKFRSETETFDPRKLLE